MKQKRDEGPQPGITRIDIDIGMAERILPRKPFPLLDLRVGDENRPGFDGDQVFEKDTAFMAAQYAHAVPLKPDPLHVAEDLVLFGGPFWLGDEIVIGSLPRNTPPERVEAMRAAQLHFKKHGKLLPLSGTTAMIHTGGFRNYFHWMTEALPRLYPLAERLRQGETIDRILLPIQNPSPFVMQSIEQYFPELVPLVMFSDTARYRCERALFYVDWRYVGQTLTRAKDTSTAFAASIRPRLDGLPRGGRAFLISRSDADNRRLINEDAVCEALSDWSVEPITCGQLSVAQQSGLMTEAKLIIGVHGAGMTNAMFCRPGTPMIEITSTQYITRARSYADLAFATGLNYGLAVIDQHGENYVVVKNRGNDLYLAPESMGALRDLAHQLSA